MSRKRRKSCKKRKQCNKKYEQFQIECQQTTLRSLHYKRSMISESHKASGEFSEPRSQDKSKVRCGDKTSLGINQNIKNNVEREATIQCTMSENQTDDEAGPYCSGSFSEAQPEIITLVMTDKPGVLREVTVEHHLSPMNKKTEKDCLGKEMACSFPNVKVKIQKVPNLSCTDMKTTLVLESKQYKGKKCSETSCPKQNYCTCQCHDSSSTNGNDESYPTTDATEDTVLLKLHITTQEVKHDTTDCQHKWNFQKPQEEHFKGNHPSFCCSTNGNWSSNDTDCRHSQRSYSSYAASELSCCDADCIPGECLRKEWSMQFPPPPPDQFADWEEHSSLNTFAEKTLSPMDDNSSQLNASLNPPTATAENSCSNSEEDNPVSMSARTLSPPSMVTENQQVLINSSLAASSQCCPVSVEDYRFQRTSLSKESIEISKQKRYFRKNSTERNKDRLLANLESHARRRKTYPGIIVDDLSTICYEKHVSFSRSPSFPTEALSKHQSKQEKMHAAEDQKYIKYSQPCLPSANSVNHWSSETNSKGLKPPQKDMVLLPNNEIFHLEYVSEEGGQNASGMEEVTTFMPDSRELEEPVTKSFSSHDTLHEYKIQQFQIDPVIKTCLSDGTLHEDKIQQFQNSLKELKDLGSHGEYQNPVHCSESGFEVPLDGDYHDEVPKQSVLVDSFVSVQDTSPPRSTSCSNISNRRLTYSLTSECVNNPDTVSQQFEMGPFQAPNVKKRRSSVMTIMLSDLEPRLIVQSGCHVPNAAINSSVSKEVQEELTSQQKLEYDLHPLPESEVNAHNKDDEVQSCLEINSPSNSSIVLSENSMNHEVMQITDVTSLLRSTCDKEVPSENSSSDNIGEKPPTSDNVIMQSSSVPGKIEMPLEDKKTENPADICESMTLMALSEPVACQIIHLARTTNDISENKLEEEQSFQKTENLAHCGTHKIPHDRMSYEFRHLKFPNETALKEAKAKEKAQEEASERWAKRRKQFKESRQYSSTGESSVTSNITEESVNSEETRSVDLGMCMEFEDKGFYTETFHSASWIFRGDDALPTDSPRCLSKRPRPVAIRERTVKIAKGTGDYPWGFRIQFSKPILVTEIDTNGAAEEAGLLVGDTVTTVNGTDVTSVPHFEAANLARQGPNMLTLVVGSDISRCPNTPRPTCRGYLHKRTQSGLLKGWRKRWFVLKYDGCLYYYKNKKDEGKCRPFEMMKLEGADVGSDTSLGKPFVFKCIPQAGNRTFYFCAPSGQEMKRWLEAMERAVHPVHQNHVWVDVTRHNANLPPLGIRNPECLGLLDQMDKNNDAWVQHYCVLKDSCLYFYASIRATYAQGGIYLQGYTVSEQCLGLKRSVIELKPPSEEFKIFHLCAENVSENKRWIVSLKSSISKWLPLHQAIQDFMNRPPEETRM